MIQIIPFYNVWICNVVYLLPAKNGLQAIYLFLQCKVAAASLLIVSLNVWHTIHHYF